MARDGAEIVEQARKYLANLNKETGANVQKDLGQYWANYGQGPDMTPKNTAIQYEPQKKNARTDMQKKKEDRLEVKSTVNAAQIKRDRTKKQYDDYINSEEYRQKQAESVRAQQQAMDQDETQVFSSTSDMMPPAPKQDQKEYMLRMAKDAAEREYNEAEDRKRFEADMEVITGLPEEQRLALERYSASKYGGRDIFGDETIDEMMEEYGRPRLDELERTFSRDKNAKRAEEVDAKAREFVSKRGGRGTLANILSIPVQAYSGIIGTGGQLAEMMIGTGGYKTQDPNAYGTIGQTLTGAIRGQTSENITEDLGDGFLGKAASTGYQAVMSAADSVARAYMGGGAFGGATLAATGSFSQTMADASRQGATPAQAALLATATAGIEAATEKIPLDDLIKVAKGKGASTVLKNLLRQAGIEASTEELSLFGTMLAEAAVLQEKSQYNQTLYTELLAGKPEAEARQAAAMEIWNEVVNTALVSGLSGGLSSLGGSYADYRGWFADTQEQINPELNRPKNSQQAVQDAIANNQARRERLAAEEVTQQPQTIPVQQEAAQPAMQQEAPQQAQQTTTQQSEEQNLTDIYTEMFTQMRENNGKASNRMVESVMSDPAAMQELGIAPEGTKAEQRRRVKEEMEKLFQKQNPQTETTRNVPEAEPMQATETSEQATMQASTPTADMQMGANDQSADGGQIKGTGAAERNFSGVAAYEDMLSDDNVQRQRPNAARDVEMPKVDSDGRRVTEFAKNVSDAEVTPEPLADAVKSLVGDKKLSFDTRSNQESLNNAAEAIRAQGDTAVIADIHAHAEAKTVKDGDIEKGLVLYAQYANDPDPKSQETAAQIIVDMAALANMSGRNLQLFSLMQRLTPEGRIKVLKKDLSRSIKQINAGRSKNKQVDLSKPGVMTDKKATEKVLGDDVDVYINEELAQKFLDAKTDKEKEAVMDEIYKDVASRIKPTLGEVWDAWRNLAMLGNFKTHERNILSTAAYQPYQSVKRVIGTVLEKTLRLDPEQRTKSVLGIGKKSQDLLKWTRADAKNDNVQKLMQRSGTTGNEARSAIQEYRQILPGILDKASKKNIELMEKADMRFKKREYALSLASFLKARGYTAADLQNGNVPNGVLDEGRQIAVREAMKATFNDSNKLSDALVKYGKANERDGSKVLNIFKKGTVPFLRTPANVVARAVENNPLTMVANLATAKKDIESGRKSAADVLDGLSANLAGGVGVAIGALLGSGAFENVELIGSIEDEEELREGAQEYSVRIGDKYYNVAWLAPAMIPLFLGANLARNNYFAGFQDADGWDIAKSIVDLGADTLEPILELSMLSSLNDAVKKFTNEEDPGDGAMAVFLNSLTSYVQQGLPTIIGQAEQATETEKSSTFVNTDNKLEEIMKNAISYASKRVPGVDLYQTQKLDEWGNVVQNEGDSDSRIFNAFFNPSTVTTRKTDPVMQEIARLNKSQENNVSPDYAPKVITYTDKDGNLHKDQRLTEEQYQTFAKTQGQTARQLVEELIKSRSYETMSDEQKAEAINLAYTYARETAEKAAFPDSLGYSEKWLMETDTAKNKAGYILNKVGTAMLSGAMGKIDSAWDNNYSAENVKSLSDQLAKDFEAYSKMPRADKTVVYEGLTGTTKKYVEAREKGVSHDDFLKTAKTINNVKGTGKYDKNTGKNAVRDIDKRAAIAGVSNLTPGARDILMKAYMTDYDPTDESPTKTEPKYDFIRKEMGLSAKDYVDSYRVYLDVSGKNKEIKGIMNAINCDYATARKLRNLYGGWYKGSDWKNYIADY